MEHESNCRCECGNAWNTIKVRGQWTCADPRDHLPRKIGKYGLEVMAKP